MGETTIITGWQLETALNILERERPSPQERFRFELLQLAVRWALLFSVGWVVLIYVLPVAQWPVLVLALLCYFASVALSVVNLGLVQKLWRTAAIQRRIDLPHAFHVLFRARRRHGRLQNLLTLALSLFGVPLCLAGSGFLVLELSAPTADGIAIAASMIVFGFACVVIHFIARAKDRLDVLGELRERLQQAGRGDGQGVALEDEDYDHISAIERAQIRREQEQCQEAATYRRSEHRTYALRISQGVQAQMSSLTPEDFVRVNERIDLLLSEPRGPVQDTTTGVSFVTVEATSFTIGFSVNDDSREIRLISLLPVIESGNASGTREG